MSPVRRSRVARATVAAVIACGVALTGCSGSSDSEPRPTAAPSEAKESGTTLEDVDTAALVVPRGPFCDRVDPAAATRALGEEPADVSAYRSGQRIKISDDVADVVHEFGCRWTAGDSSAEAWVFAPPITRQAGRGPGARRAGPVRSASTTSAPTSDGPSASCASRDDDAVAMSFQGLFGDAWLTCSLTLAEGRESQVDERASRWCAAVATGAAAAD